MIFSRNQDDLIEKSIKKYCPDKVVLDLGAGNFKFSKMARNCGATTVYAVDIKSPVKKVRNIKFFQEDAEKTHFKDNSFDVIICKGLIEYIDMYNGIRELKRLIRDNGIILLQEKDSRGIRHKIYQLSLNLRNRSVRGMPPKFKILSKLLESNFEIINTYETIPLHNIYWILKNGVLG